MAQTVPSTKSCESVNLVKKMHGEGGAQKEKYVKIMKMKVYGIWGKDKTISCASSGTEGIARDLPSIELLSPTSSWQICYKCYHKLCICTCDEGISNPTPCNGEAVAVRPPTLMYHLAFGTASSAVIKPT